MCGELETKNRLHQEDHIRSCKEIEELRRRCYKEENKLTQYRLDEYSTHQDRDPNTVSHLEDQIRKLQVNFLSDAREFHDPDSGSSSGISHVPDQPLITSSSRRKPSRDSLVPRDTREDMSIPGHVFACQPARGHPEEFFENSKNWQHVRERQEGTGLDALWLERKM